MEKNKPLKELGEAIKKHRKEKGLTQALLAHRVNKDQQSIQRLEAARINPSYLYLLEVCEDGLEIKLSTLLKNLNK